MRLRKDANSKRILKLTFEIVEGLRVEDLECEAPP